MVAGLEVARLIRDFEDASLDRHTLQEARHCDQSLVYTKASSQMSMLLVAVTEGPGSPFQENSQELLVPKKLLTLMQ